MSSEERTNALPKESTKEPYHATKADGWFSVACFVLGMLYVRWAGFQQGVGIALFTLFYAGVVLVYATAKGIKPTKTSWFWLIILLLTGISCCLWSGYSMMAWRLLLLYGSAIYWCASLFGGLLANKTSNYLLLDAINLLFLVPFKILCYCSVRLRFLSGKDQWKQKKNQNQKIVRFCIVCLVLYSVFLF